MIRYIHIVLGLAIYILSACAPSAVREAQYVVTQADSMWRAGQPCDDSLQLVQAYETLDRWQWLYADDYAHACYHYGRLLRQENDPVSAMQVFINATHSRTHDYHILGRVYSNMGSICHLAEDFQLSYDMYVHSARSFLYNGDTINYYYAINDMAYELADQGKIEETLVLLDSIILGCSDRDVLCKLNETKAEMYLRVGQYDSAIHYSTLFYEKGKHELTGLLIRAQSYSLMRNKDSAVYYANYIISLSQELFTLNSALYILTQDDDSKCRDGVRKASADRSDVQKLIEIRKAKLAQGAQLLEQDLHRKPDLRWLHAIIATLTVIGISTYIYIRKNQKRHQLLSQQIDNLETKNKQNLSQRRAMIDEKCMLFTNSKSLKVELHWNDYDTMCNYIDMHFYLIAKKLQQKQVLNEQEIRLCILTLLNISRSQIADVLPYALNGVGKLKYRVAQKLGIQGKNLRKYLICLAIDEPYK